MEGSTDSTYPYGAIRATFHRSLEMFASMYHITFDCKWLIYISRSKTWTHNFRAHLFFLHRIPKVLNCKHATSCPIMATFCHGTTHHNYTVAISTLRGRFHRPTGHHTTTWQTCTWVQLLPVLANLKVTKSRRKHALQSVYTFAKCFSRRVRKTAKFAHQLPPVRPSAGIPLDGFSWNSDKYIRYFVWKPKGHFTVSGDINSATTQYLYTADTDKHRTHAACTLRQLRKLATTVCLLFMRVRKIAESDH
jgi:hypothetical protein